MKWIALALMASCTPAYAQQVPCFPRDQVYHELSEVHKESRVFEGLADGGILEVWASDKGWTAFVVTPGGGACIVATGKEYGIYELEGQL